jgi:hypothetical protein
MALANLANILTFYVSSGNRSHHTAHLIILISSSVVYVAKPNYPDAKDRTDLVTQ